MSKKQKSILAIEKKSCWDIWDNKTKQQAFSFCDGYKTFLDNAKTEREAVLEGIKMAKKNGFVSYEELQAELVKSPTKKIVGRKVYFNNRDKNLFLAVLGKKDLSVGINMLIAHVDSPRLDLKVLPLYEEESVALFKTHYYGGIKKYHWPTVPLALHGVVVLASGRKVDICIGEKESDPIFMISDLLIHLSREQMKKTLGEGIDAEELNIIVGSIPVEDKKVKERVKTAVLEYLQKEYKMIEEDFVSAEIQAVPSQKARDLGFDRSLIAAYGQDDRSSAYGILQTVFDISNPEKTVLAVLTDKEEVGSNGVSGINSLFFEQVLDKLCKLTKFDGTVGDILSASRALSADVVAAYDPDYRSVFDAKNVARLNHGVALEKYTGHGGKMYASEASAEFVGTIRKILNDNKIVWQMGGMGKVDAGGGGTIAFYLANRNVDVMDCGVPLFNMHAPMEISSKGDIYSSYLAYKAFCINA